MRNKMESINHNEDIPISIFKGINIQFPGDVYFLSILVAMSDRSKSTPTHQVRTTLTGFAKKVASTYGLEFPDSHRSDGVMSLFRKHGIKGNPMLIMEEKDEQILSVLLSV
jgi:hypothetical protein